MSNSTQVTELATFEFQFPDGAYTYDVQAPAGYYPNPSHGNVTVQGQPMVVSIAFLPVGPGPAPVAALLMSAGSAGVALALAAAGMFLLLGAIRRRTSKRAGRSVVPRPDRDPAGPEVRAPAGAASFAVRGDLPGDGRASQRGGSHIDAEEATESEGLIA